MTTQQGSIRIVENGHESIPNMEAPGSKAFIGDVHSNPDGSEVCSGFFELLASEPLEYEYTYDEMKIVLEGEFVLTEKANGQVVRARPKDVLFFPKGTVVTFETPDRGLAFYTAHRSFTP